MTSNKAFKRRVRARAQRTGESYTTARRQMLATAGRVGATAAPEAVLPGHHDTGGGVSHDSALLANLLRGAGITAPHTGAPYTEAMLAGLAGGIGFMYFAFSYEGHPPTMTVVTRHHPEPYLPAALTRAGVGFQIDRTGSARKAEAGLRRVLAQRRVALCEVDRGGLPWHGPACGWGAEPHQVAVVGLDGDRAWLDDEALWPRQIAVADLMTAWSAHAKGRHAMLSITQPPGGIDLVAAIRDAVTTTVAHLTGPVLGNRFDVNFGLSGMRKLADHLADLSGARGWARMYHEPAALFSALRRLHDCLEVEYGAPGATRPLYAEFLAEAALVTGEPNYQEAAEIYREAGAVWSDVAATAINAAEPLSGCDELVDERLRLLFAGDDDGTRMTDLRRRADALAARYAATPLSPAAVHALLGRLAEKVDRALALEKRAVVTVRG